MKKLITLVMPLLPIMCLAVVLGVLGYLCAISLTIFAGYMLLYRPAGPVSAALLAAALLRGIFHYGEQYCNHFIAFKLLAIIRHRVFDALRGLCPAKLEGKDRGNLISVITSDIELLEVFYAHAVSPVAIAVLTILMFSFGMLFFMLWNLERGNVGFDRMLLVVLAMMGSFGPVVALSNLSNNLNQTLASAQRVFSLLEEEPQTKDVKGEETAAFHGASARRVNFSYAEEQILKEYSIDFPKGKTVGIHGASGSGKSTLLKLLMRFWDVDEGCVKISERDIRRINTGDLRAMEACVTQETCLFHDSIANNIALGRRNASRAEIMEAARKASVHDFIMSLPKGYDTEVGELGDTLSGGERQRIGIARAFLHDAPFLLLDEPTSNLDALNEGIILKALKEYRGDRTVVLVSHRKSTLGLADMIYEMDHGRIS